jgi:ketosteroid isomerase-like protein
MLYRPDTESVGADVWNTIGAEMETRGREDRIAYQRTILADWDELRFDSEEIIQLGEDRLVSVGRMSGRGRASGATVETPWAVVLIIEDGLVARERIFLDRQEALEAAASD